MFYFYNKLAEHSYLGYTGMINDLIYKIYY